MCELHWPHLQAHSITCKLAGPGNLHYSHVIVTWPFLPVSQQHFWWAVLQSATECVEEFSRLHVGCASEVNQFQMKSMIQNNVFILNNWSTEHYTQLAYDQTYRPYQQKESGYKDTSLIPRFSVREWGYKDTSLIPRFSVWEWGYKDNAYISTKSLNKDLEQALCLWVWMPDNYFDK